MNIIFLDTSTIGCDISIDSLKALGSFSSYEQTSSSQVVNRSINADIIITNKVVFDKDILEKLPKLKLICIAATGMNNVDLKAATDLGIQVKNVSGYSTYSVAQHTFTMLFELISNIRKNKSFVHSGGWISSDIFTNIDNPFYELRGKKWGIIGLGQIGKRVATIASAFGADVQYFSTTGNNNDLDFRRVCLEELLSDSDIISIHAPLNTLTQNLIGTTELKKLRKGTVLLNLGRGGIINENDLPVFIKEQNIFVGLDVLEKEPMSEDSALIDLLDYPNLLVTPHIAWSSIEARKALLSGIVKNINNFLCDD